MSTTIKHVADAIAPADSFVHRHVGPDPSDVAAMLETLGYGSLDELIDQTVPERIRFRRGLALPKGMTEPEVLTHFRAIAAKNQVFRSFIGMGYSDCITPPVIQRNIIENPGWYTAYTPYQAEIAQGRLEALLNFQTMVIDLTGLEIANASLLDEATAAAEAMTMSYALKGKPGKEVFLVASECHPQVIEVVRTRAGVRGITVQVASYTDLEIGPSVFGVLVQYPATNGAVFDYSKTCEQARAADALVTVAADLLSLVLLTPPGEWGADIVVGNTQRFGVPLGYGGPHAAFFATRDEYKRQIPGRIIGVSRDADGQPALRMALQTREQHIRREKATSNVCTAQVLLAVVASMYAVYHGPAGLTRIARRVHGLTSALAEGLKRLGFTLAHEDYFDTLAVRIGKRNAATIIEEARRRRINLRQLPDKTLVVALDETANEADVSDLLLSFNGGKSLDFGLEEVLSASDSRYDERFKRTRPFMTHPVFNKHHAETEMLRYMNRLQSRDLSLVHSMIPLGSCTMKLNATTEMMPITWRGFAKIHPFAPVEQTAGYQQLFQELESALAEITGFAAVSLQPNAGSQGEYAGLLAIDAYHASRNDSHRNVCLIPQSAHGTNPASAVMAGMKVVVVKTDERGNIQVDDLRAKAEA
ncbi:MAG: aminomethyl-transferring glycine dehydrogenase, partial [Gemmatimonadaceae bacterium]